MSVAVPGQLVGVAGEQLRVHVERVERTGPALVFSNGLGMPLDNWDPVTARIPDLSCVRFDRPGLGGSPAGDRAGVDLGGEIDRLLSVADSTVPGRPLLLVGHSYGGLIVEATARLHPERVAGLVLVDPTDPADYASTAECLDAIRMRIARGMLARPQLGAWLARATEWAATRWFTLHRDGPMLAESQRRLVSTTTHVATMLHEDARLSHQCRQASELGDRLPMADIPVQVLVASHTGGPLPLPNRRWVKRNQRRLGALGDQATMQVLRSAHLMMFDVPAEVAMAIRAVAETVGVEANGMEKS